MKYHLLTLDDRLVISIDPLLFLGCSVLLVAVSLTALVVAAFPAIQDVSRAARSAEKLFDRLDRELTPTLKAIELAGLELSDLSDEMSQGVQSAAAVAQQVDLSISEVKKQAGNIKVTTQSVWAGIGAAWQSWRDSVPERPLRQRFAPSDRPTFEESGDSPEARLRQRRYTESETVADDDDL